MDGNSDQLQHFCLGTSLMCTTICLQTCLIYSTFNLLALPLNLTLSPISLLFQFPAFFFFNPPISNFLSRFSVQMSSSSCQGPAVAVGVHKSGANSSTSPRWCINLLTHRSCGRSGVDE